MNCYEAYEGAFRMRNKHNCYFNNVVVGYISDLLNTLEKIMWLFGLFVRCKQCPCQSVLQFLDSRGILHLFVKMSGRMLFSVFWCQLSNPVWLFFIFVYLMCMFSELVDGRLTYKEMWLRPCVFWYTYELCRDVF